ncbi:PAS domain-containing sensor histidine kinase [Microbacterium oleivorans]|uniref:Sensor-like histidine kinase SenX3 n=1 Tax=Microbacterium oleivorans TaxID=273677 RepID=A0A7D5K0Z2_9MICO|nr:PAS domain-containing sensor histidine kinase [Microbacterium oleivorans]QLD13323.1 PAS domain-containing sensor histidine kinase [Microbacterium oleivorans]
MVVLRPAATPRSEAGETEEAVDWAAQVSSVAIVRLDAVGLVRSWNPGAERLKGYAAADIVGTSFSRFYRPDDRDRGWPERLLSTARDEGSVEDTGWRVRSDGSLFWAHVLITAVRDGEGVITGFVKIVRDLTDAKRLDDEKDDFLRAFAHDLISPITALRGYVDLLEDEVPAAQAGLVQHVSRVADHLIAMAGELAAHARGAPGDESAETDILPLVHEAAELVLPGDVNDRVRIRGAGRANLTTDRAMLRRAVANVIDNAAKYSEDVIVVTVAEQTDATVVTVADTGRGIDPADVPSIFEPYHRGRLSDPGDGGTGVGLASVRDLLHRLGGDASIASAPGVGTTVTLRLPPAG